MTSDRRLDALRIRSRTDSTSSAQLSLSSVPSLRGPSSRRRTTSCPHRATGRFADTLRSATLLLADGIREWIELKGARQPTTADSVVAAALSRSETTDAVHAFPAAAVVGRRARGAEVSTAHFVRGAATVATITVGLTGLVAPSTTRAILALTRATILGCTARLPPTRAGALTGGARPEAAACSPAIAADVRTAFGVAVVPAASARAVGALVREALCAKLTAFVCGQPRAGPTDARFDDLAIVAARAIESRTRIDALSILRVVRTALVAFVCGTTGGRTRALSIAA